MLDNADLCQNNSFFSKCFHEFWCVMVCFDGNTSILVSTSVSCQVLRRWKWFIGFDENETKLHSLVSFFSSFLASCLHCHSSICLILLKSFSCILQSKLVCFKSSCEIFLKWKVFYLKFICLNFKFFLFLVQASCIHISQLIAEHW